MSGIQQTLLGGSPAGYQIERSLRFNSADSAYLNRTLTTPTNNLKWTWSGWVKRSGLTAANYLFCAGDGTSNNSAWLTFNATDGINFYQLSGGSYNLQMTTSAVFRDPSAWYHIVLIYDSANATSTNRVQIYVNGVLQAVTYAVGPFAQNTTSRINSAIAHYIAKLDYTTLYFNGYMTEVNFIDGQALEPSSFGETDSATGVWKPKKFSGTYGTNGFYLNFSDNSNTTAATLGKDSSGNGNNWTPNNFSVTAGAGNDSLVDTPTSYGSDTGVGGEVRGNYATLNPLDKDADITLSNANLNFSQGATTGSVRGTIGMSSGKWYWEMTVTAIDPLLGIAKSNATLDFYPGYDTNGWGYFGSTGNKYNGAGAVAYGATFTTNDVIGVAFDADAGTLVFYKNNSSQGTAFTGLTSGPYFPSVGRGDNTPSASFNFGQRPFAYTAPSGFKALCTQNLPTPTIGATSTTQANDYMNIVLYTGNGGTSQSITGVGFQPDFVWIKKRSGAEQHEVQDAVRGATKRLASNLTDAETTVSSSIVSFNSDGFTVGNAGSTGENGFTYVGWNWNAGGSNATNTSGTITSTVRANTTAGFSIVTYTGNGTTGTVGHGLGVTPSMIIVKSRSTAQRWTVFHTSTSNAYIYLNETFAADTANAQLRFGNNTSVVQPTSTLFTIGNSVDVNQSTTTYVAYCFAAVAGYSAFGSYTGNGSADGPFVFLNFRPAFVMLKRSDSTSNWTILDFKRAGYNVDNDQLYPNLSNAEATTDLADLLSNGFKLRSTDTSVNASGGTYIYAAFAESPFKFSLAR